MPTPVFASNAANLGGVFNSNKCKLQFVTDGPGVTGALAQQLQFTFMQNLTRIYEIGNDTSTDVDGQPASNVYVVIGRTQGQGNIRRIIGPQATITQFYENYGDACQMCKHDLSLTFKDMSCCPISGSFAPDQASVTYTLKHVAMYQLEFALQAQDMIASDTVHFQFIDLMWDDNAAAAGGGGGSSFGP